MSSDKPNTSINVSPEEIKERGEKVALEEIEESFHPDKENRPLEEKRREDWEHPIFVKRLYAAIPNSPFPIPNKR